MIPASFLWVVFTIFGSLGQVVRNAAQRSLIDSIGTIGATQVRFLFGLPFAALFLILLHFSTGEALPVIGATSFAWTVLGALAQILATALMLAAMKDKSFVVTTALIKTEAVQVAAFGFVFLHESLKPLAILAIFVATAGVMVLSWPRAIERPAPKAIALGIIAGAFFGLSSVGYRGGILAASGAGFVLTSTTVLTLALTLQCVVLGIYLAWRDQAAAAAIWANWRGSMLAGFVGALASEFWFLAFSQTSAANVRTLALIEMLFALALSKLYFHQSTSRREIFGMALVCVGVVMIVQA